MLVIVLLVDGADWVIELYLVCNLLVRMLLIVFLMFSVSRRIVVVILLLDVTTGSISTRGVLRYV